jgi:hypothetical protein
VGFIIPLLQIITDKFGYSRSLAANFAFPLRIFFISIPHVSFIFISNPGPLSVHEWMTPTT